MIFYNIREGNLFEKVNYFKKVEVNFCEVEVYGKYLILKIVMFLYDKNFIYFIYLKKRVNYFVIIFIF